MAKNTSSPGSFIWDGTNPSPPTNVSTGDTIYSSKTGEMKTNADFVDTNLETCWNEKAARYITKYQSQKSGDYTTYRITNYDVKKETQHDGRNVTALVSNFTSRYINYLLSDLGYYVSSYWVNNRAANFTSYFGTDQTGWGSHSAFNSPTSASYAGYHTTYYADYHSTRNDTLHSTHDVTQCGTVNASNRTTDDDAHQDTQHDALKSSDNDGQNSSYNVAFDDQS